MSPLVPGRATAPVITVAQLTDATAALEEAVAAGGAQLPADVVAHTAGLIAKVEERTTHVGDHTVVALAGATGSGKSSLFNTLVGAEVATVGVRRPTTSTPTAAIWGERPAGDLLTWLGVGHRHSVEGGEAPGAGSLDGLVLLDLPDVDSREEANRAEAERVLDLVDVFVWVTDPQKYADARLHDDYVARLAHHEAVMVVVLNQADRLTPDQVAVCIEDLRRILARDGVPGASVLPVSARTGQGVPELRQRLANAVASAAAARTRLAGDIRTEAASLGRLAGSSEATLDRSTVDDLVDALATAAGVPTVVSAIARDHKMEAIASTGWPFTRWLQAFRARPLRRLRLDRTSVTVTESDVRSVLGRSSLPPPTPAARAAVTLATQRVGDQAAAGLPVPWAEAVHDAAAPDDNALADALDKAIVATPLRSRAPLWWKAVSVVHLLLVVAVVVGVLWLLARLALTGLGFSPLDLQPPTLGIVPVPLILIVGGLLAGLFLALLARWFAGFGARRRAKAVGKDLHAAIGEVAQERIVAPVQAVLDRHTRMREALARAARF